MEYLINLTQKSINRNYFKLVYYILSIYIVQQFSEEKHKNCAFWVKSMKLGILMQFFMLKNIGYGAKRKNSKWPPFSKMADISLKKYFKNHYLYFYHTKLH